MKLIDADHLMERLRQDPLYALVERYNIEGAIGAEPEVVRCKVCRYRDDEDGFCRGRGWPEQLVPDDGFCDKGIKRGGEDNG